MGRRKSKPEPVGAVLARLLTDRGLGGSTQMAKLAARWEDAVGRDVARHARPEMLKGGLLTMVVDNSTWMNQLAMLRTTIIQQVNSAIGGEHVDDLRFRLGEMQKGPAGRKEAPFVPGRRKVPPEEKAAIEESLTRIGDDAVRDKARRLLTSSCSRKK